MTDQPARAPGGPDVPTGQVSAGPPPFPAPPPAATWAPAPPPIAEPPAQPAGWVGSVPPSGWGVPPSVSAPASGWGAPASGWGAPPSASAPASAPTTPTWGAPAPVQVMARPKVLARSGMKTTLSVAAIMVGVVLGVNIVNAAVPLPTEYVEPGTNPAILADPSPDPGQPEPTIDPGQTAAPVPTPAPAQTGAPALPTAAPLEPGPVSAGTTITVNERYSMVMPDGWVLVEESDGVLFFQKGSVTFIVGGTAFDGTVTELASAYRDAFFENGNLTGEEPAVGVTNTGIPVAGLNYTGTLASAQVDGFILAVLEGGSGMINNAFGPTGSVQALSDDISLIIDSIKRVGE